MPKQKRKKYPKFHWNAGANKDDVQGCGDGWRCNSGESDLFGDALHAARRSVESLPDGEGYYQLYGRKGYTRNCVIRSGYYRKDVGWVERDDHDEIIEKKINP